VGASCILTAGFSVLYCAAAVAADQVHETKPPEQQEIIVTGERVRRSVKDTPSSVAVIRQRDIEAASAERVEQVLVLIPNVQLGSGSQGPTIRGQDTTGALHDLPAFLGGNRPRTTLIVDGRRIAYHEFVFGAQPVWDVDRIEVFRTPQTTTQGVNSIAGAIFVYSNEPTFEPEYRARAIVGNYRTAEVSAVGSGALIADQLAFRLDGDFRYSHTSSRIADVMVGAEPNHDVFGLARFKLLALPHALPGWRLTLTYTHAQSQAPQVEGVKAPFRQRRDPVPVYGIFRTNVDALTAQAEVEAARDLRITAVTSAGGGRFKRLAHEGLGQAQISGRDWSAEAVFNWSSDGPLGAVGGISYSRSALRQFIDLSLLSGIGRFRDWQDARGLFGEARVSVLPKVTLTAGLRYQRDSQTRRGALETVSLDYGRSFHAWLPKLSAAYDFTPDFRAGLLVQRAYNPGGTTLRFDTGAPDSFRAEHLWDYELFARAKLAGGALTANANLFYSDMRDAQRAKDIRIPTPAGPSVGFADLFNVPKARTLGLEVTVGWHPARTLDVAAGLGLLDTKILRADGPYALYHGKQFQRSPHFTGSVSIDWRPMNRLRFSAQVQHNASYFSDDLDDPLLRVKGSTRMNARAEWSAAKLNLFAYGRNLFDKFSITYLFDRNSGEAVDPREVGVGIETNF
jgi:outer membrane receptor protein involved in Fe transport